MLRRLSIRALVFAMLAGLVAVTIGGGATALWYAGRMEAMLAGVFDEDMLAYRAADKLAAALVMQKGLATYYFLDGDPRWLDELAASQREFAAWEERARSALRDDVGRTLFRQIEAGYARYVASRDEVIGLYARGERERGALLHRGVREQFHALRGLCEQFKALHEERMERAAEEARGRLRVMRGAALGAMPLALGLAVVLAVFVARQLLAPIRQLAREMDSGDRSEPLLVNEVKDLGRKVRDLLDDVDQTQSKLRKSREQMAQAEKWAMTGKLAAGVAHSIRNPLTSVKIRLFSLGRSLALAPEQKEDFQVISEEIGHIDGIARNFLEFSRPPKLKMQRVSLSDVVDMTVLLTRHRLESYEIPLTVQRGGRLPLLNADPDQLKEVLANLVFNACEAMGHAGGGITLSEEVGFADPLGKVAVVRVADTGPGIPEDMLDTVFEPFVSSKEEGTGLGLSIARRIVEEHGGWLTVRSRPGEGATFTLTLPCKEDGQWVR
ncbi:MAG: ATP-binding protein [Thermodesulfobacteriota bacterium]